jgi:hypothetical protein
VTIAIIAGLVLLALIAVSLAFIAGLGVGASFERTHAHVREIDDDLPEQITMSIRESVYRTRVEGYGIQHDA